MELKPDETGNAIVPVLACVLNQLCMRNDRLPMSRGAVSKFHALRPPAISIRDYLARVAKYAACSGECFVLALVYIDRIIQANPSFVVNSLNIHRLLITSVMLAAKFFDDQYFNNAYYAKVGGVPCAEMNSLEAHRHTGGIFVHDELYSLRVNGHLSPILHRALQSRSKLCLWLRCTYRTEIGHPSRTTATTTSER